MDQLMKAVAKMTRLCICTTKGASGAMHAQPPQTITVCLPAMPQPITISPVCHSSACHFVSLEKRLVLQFYLSFVSKF
jgi:hypothetical protein